MSCLLFILFIKKKKMYGKENTGKMYGMLNCYSMEMVLHYKYFRKFLQGSLDSTRAIMNVLFFIVF